MSRLVQFLGTHCRDMRDELCKSETFVANQVVHNLVDGIKLDVFSHEGNQSLYFVCGLRGICLALLLLLCPYQATTTILTRKLAKTHEKNASAGPCVCAGRIKTRPRHPESLPLWPFGLDQV